MVFLASILESYESLVARKIGNPMMTKDDYDQIDPEEMELFDISWCMASVIRHAQRFMEIMGRECVGGPNTKFGFYKSKVTCFKCKQKGHFKQEFQNQSVSDSANPFNEDYYKIASSHRNREQPPKVNRPQIKEGSSSKDKTRALIVTHEDERFDWSKYIPDEGPSAFVDKRVYNREEDTARKKLGEIKMIYKEAVEYNRWDEERQCYLDREENIATDPATIDFDALVKTIPTVEEEHAEVLVAMIKEKAEKEVKLNAAKNGLEIIDVKQELTVENLRKMADNALMAKPNKVESSTVSAESSNQVRSLNDNVENGKSIDEKFMHCIKMCKIYTEKENGLKSKIDELTQK
ncbi:putative transcription factor interactor and regulator CCHC(Zn) family [Helianthus debilis subsp. tardiflorus]